MQNLENWIILWLNRHSFASPELNKAIHILADRDELKGIPFMLVFWMLWFRKSDRQPSDRRILISALGGGLLALFTSRLLTDTLPNRLRPMIDPELGFRIPAGITEELLPKMSSFPSDHAALFFGLAFGILAADRVWGALLLGYAALFIALPRVYLGYHYPLDILAGLGIGALCTLAAVKIRPAAGLAESLVRIERFGPGWFYPALFLVTYEFATMFDGLRDVYAILTGKKI